MLFLVFPGFFLKAEQPFLLNLTSMRYRELKYRLFSFTDRVMYQFTNIIEINNKQNIKVNVKNISTNFNKKKVSVVFN